MQRYLIELGKKISNGNANIFLTLVIIASCTYLSCIYTLLLIIKQFSDKLKCEKEVFGWQCCCFMKLKCLLAIS